MRVLCGGCDRSFDITAVKKCSNCVGTYYCSVKCQRDHWSFHKLVCGPPHALPTVTMQEFLRLEKDLQQACAFKMAQARAMNRVAKTDITVLIFSQASLDAILHTDGPVVIPDAQYVHIPCTENHRKFLDHNVWDERHYFPAGLATTTTTFLWMCASTPPGYRGIPCSINAQEAGWTLDTLLPCMTPEMVGEYLNKRQHGDTAVFLRIRSRCPCGSASGPCYHAIINLP